MRASFAIIAAVAATASAQQYGPISQISDGQIQNPTTPPAASSAAPVTSAASLTSATPVASHSSVVVVPPPVVSSIASVISSLVGTGKPTGTALPTGPYANGTTVATSVVPTSAKGSSAASSSKAAGTSAAATGAASAQQVGSFGFAAAVAALFLA